jgi:hypothetical protein
VLIDPGVTRGSARLPSKPAKLHRILITL